MRTLGEMKRRLGGFSRVLLVFVCAPLSVPATDTGHMVRVKDVAAIEGIRDNQLVGYGLVVGLHGTGDSQQTIFPAQTLVSALQRMGITVPQTGAISAANMQVKNMAGVFVVATLPPFTDPGYKLDVTVSSAGDARSLDGGILLMTPLYGPDGKIFAQAQGALVLGGYLAAAGGNTRQVNHPTTARIPAGGIVERDAGMDMSRVTQLFLLLRDPDFQTATDAAAAIESELGKGSARAIDSRRIEVQMPTQGSVTVPGILAKVNNLLVAIHTQARVIVNERTGTIVMGQEVSLGACSILHGNLSVVITTEFKVSQPLPYSQGQTQVVPQTTVKATESPARRIELKEGASVDDLINGLQAIGATPRDIVAILEAIRAAGALQAELEII
jgi:flagellar P-ring protein FlgI